MEVSGWSSKKKEIGLLLSGAGPAFLRGEKGVCPSLCHLVGEKQETRWGPLLGVPLEGLGEGSTTGHTRKLLCKITFMDF